jgi:hypothetical protein
MVKPLCLIKRVFKPGFGLIALSLFLLVFTFSCNFNGRKGIKDEGVIEYSITYPDSATMRYESNMRPEKMIVKFKEKKTLTNIQGLSGAVSLSFIHNVDERLTIILVKLFNKKLFYTEKYNDGDLPLVYSQMPKVMLEPTSDNVKFQGYDCFRYIGVFEGDSLKKFDILFTNQIGIENPNEKTPYASINGLLMAFTVKLYGQTMNLRAISISKGNVHDSDFEVPRDYEMVSKETINDIFELMN